LLWYSGILTYINENRLAVRGFHTGRRGGNERGGEPRLTVVGDRKIDIKDAFGGGIKVAVVSDNMVNVYNPITKRVERTTIIRVKSNPSNKDYERRGIITKGAIVETPLGDAKITSRPGRDGVLNAVLIAPAG